MKTNPAVFTMEEEKLKSVGENCANLGMDFFLIISFC
jgi:hypothetical protein